MFNTEMFFSVTQNYAELMQAIYDKETAGDLTFEGLLFHYAFHIKVDAGAEFKSDFELGMAVNEYAEKARLIYRERTAGDYTFVGFLNAFYDNAKAV